MELSGGIDALILGGSAGYQYVSYPMLDTVAEEGWFVDPRLLGIKKENGDFIFSASASLYVAIGLGVEIDVNISKGARWIKKQIKDFFDTSKECSE